MTMEDPCASHELTSTVALGLSYAALVVDFVLKGFPSMGLGGRVGASYAYL